MFLKLPVYLSASRKKNLGFWEMDRSDFGMETTNCALRFSQRYLSKTDEIRLQVIDSDSREDISAISVPIGNAPKSFSRWHKQTSCKPQLENKNNRMSYYSYAYQRQFIYSFIYLNLDQGHCFFVFVLFCWVEHWV